MKVDFNYIDSTGNLRSTSLEDDASAARNILEIHASECREEALKGKEPITLGARLNSELRDLTKITKNQDFSGANLEGANLIGLSFKGANLDGANIKNTDLAN